MKRREFLVASALASRAVKSQGALEVRVMEIFSSSSGPSALLVHHADEATRETFANWLRSNSGKRIICRLRDGTQIAARIFRLSLCFGRGLILLPEPIVRARVRDVLSLTVEE